MLSHPDPQLDRIKHAFDGAFRRMCQAPSVAELEEELSNMLGHLYRLGNLCKIRLTPPTFYATLNTTNNLRAAHAAMWTRAFDSHAIYIVASLSTTFSNYHINLYGGVLIWKPLSSLPVSANKPRHGEDNAYHDELEGKGVLDTIRPAFDAMAALL